MKTSRDRISIKRLLWTDYPAFYASLVPPVSWIVYLSWAPDWRGNGPIMKPEARPLFLGLAILATCVSLIILAVRIRLIRRIFRDGKQVHGKILKVEIRRDHGKVEYTYIYDHKEFFSKADVHRNAETKALKAGDLVMLVVDPIKPSRAFISSLY
jgi:hypothetical protein